MIIVTLMGGLGNQMFQYACGKRLALELKQPLLLNTAFLSAHRNTPQVTPRDFELSVFTLQEEVIVHKERFGLGSAFPYRLNKVLDPLLKKAGKMTRVDDQADIALLLKNKPARILLEGYFQSQDFFMQQEARIRTAFQFRSPLSGQNKLLAEQMAGSSAVSLHVRRGDYVSDPKTADYHGTCSPAYYQQAIRHICAQVPTPHFFVFSDDIEWVRANLPIPGTATYVAHNTGAESYRDMQLMSLCRHHIIANSSFSWWGAWLNSRTDKLVIAPKKWFSRDSLNQQHRIIPNNWIQL